MNQVFTDPRCDGCGREIRLCNTYRQVIDHIRFMEFGTPGTDAVYQCDGVRWYCGGCQNSAPAARMQEMFLSSEEFAKLKEQRERQQAETEKA